MEKSTSAPLDFKIGDSASLSEKITMEKILRFADVSGDTNPIHLDNDYAKKTRFGGCIAHGVFINALISRVIGTQLPGIGSILLSLSTKYLKPARPEDIIKVTVTIKHIREGKSIITLETVATNQTEEIIVEGEAKVLINKPP